MLDIGQIHRKEYESDADLPGQIVIARAPGRVHLLGEHGEPKFSSCLSSAIDRYIYVAVSQRKDNSLRFFAANSDERKRSSITNLKYKREDRWSNYIKAAIQVFASLGRLVKGLNVTVWGGVPQQIGLASSTVMEMATVVALRAFFKVNITDRDLIGRLIKEREAFFGKPVSFADYAIILNAKADGFIIVDEHKRETRTVPIDFAGYKMLIMDSRVPRFNIEQELRQRRHDVRKGFESLFPKKELREINDKMFASVNLTELLSGLPETIRRRMLFVIQEMRRIGETEEALRKKDFQLFSRIIFHSHEGLRDLYEASCPETDWLVKRGQETEGVFGSRMTGLGFGGCTYAVIKEESIPEYKKRLEDYERIFGFHPIIYEVAPAQGAGLISV
ncbi:MAG: galactokinase [Treponema sp.]|jgi:galactokinase|nr:galactokinase [Treponema sp.]